MFKGESADPGNPRTEGTDMTTDTPRIVIIGAGIAGLACAHRLGEAGLKPVLFDKGRGPGGRLATRRATDSLQFDHGAQYVTAKGGGFAALLAAAEAAGALARWRAESDKPRHVGTPGMNALAKHLARGLDVRCGAPVSGIHRDGDEWVVLVDGAAQRCDRVVITVPAPQIAGLLGATHPLLDELAGVRMDPCLTLMAAFTTDAPRPFISRADDADALAWIALDASKPGRPAGATWVAQASPAWSATHLELAPDAIAALMLPMLCARLGAPQSCVTLAAAHRWRHARVATPLGRPFLRDATRTLHAGGDWCLDARVEAAWTSGDAIARDILASVSLPMPPGS
jgi:renalase